MALNSIISIWSSKESSWSISSSFSLSLCLSLSFLRLALILDIIVIIKHNHHCEHHQHHHYLRSAVKMDILLDALLIFSWFFEGLSPSITYMGRWVRQNSDLQASALYQWKILRYFHLSVRKRKPSSSTDWISLFSSLAKVDLPQRNLIETDKDLIKRTNITFSTILAWETLCPDNGHPGSFAGPFSLLSITPSVTECFCYFLVKL